MSKSAFNQSAVRVLCLALAFAPCAAFAEGYFSDLWKNTSFSSFMRLDYAMRTTSDQNTNNQGTNKFQNVEVERQTFVPPTLAGLPVNDNNNWAVPLPLFSDTLRRSDRVPNDNPDFSYLTLRYENEMQVRFNREFRLVGRLRALYDPGEYDDFNARSVSDQQGTGIIGGPGSLYTGRVDYFNAIGREGRRINPLEYSGRNYMVDFPALLMEYRKGGLSVRAGNQQIAWGQAIFFQTLDVPNGLDLRRHLVLDRAFEEFSDKRVPKLSVRATYQAGDVVVDSYVGKFQPTIFGNPNTPYNVIPSQFTVYDNYFSGGYNNKIDGGIRFKADYGTWGWQALYASRYNPGGNFSWARSGELSPLSGALGDTASLAYLVKLPICDGPSNPTLCRNSANVAETLSKTPFTTEPGGVYHSREWFWYAADARLNGLEGFNQAVLEFPDLMDAYVTPASSMEELSNQLNTLMVAAGGSYRGYIERDYHRENVFGLGASLVTESSIDALNAIILNLEVQYTPSRMFTNPTLSSSHLKADEWIASLVVEKWTRWTAAFPAAYLVGQYQYRSESDLVGRHLSGYGGSETKVADGISSSNYIVLAALQPFPGRKFVFEFATLFDVKGGILVQPTLQWNIGNGMGLEVFYSYINGNLYGERNDNVLSSIDWADELTLRLRYTF
jgi:hypothetical protein